MNSLFLMMSINAAGRWIDRLSVYKLCCLLQLVSSGGRILMNGERLCWHFGRSFSDTAELLQARINTHCLKSTTAFQAYMGFFFSLIKDVVWYLALFVIFLHQQILVKSKCRLVMRFIMFKVKLCHNDHAEGEMLMLNSDRKPIITGLFELLC